MNDFLKNLLKSFFLSIIINIIFWYTFSLSLNTGDVLGLINGISIIFTMLFCTFSLIDEIRKKK